MIAFAGSVSDDAVLCNANGIDAFFPIVRGATTLEKAMRTENAVKNMELTASRCSDWQQTLWYIRVVFSVCKGRGCKVKGIII